MLFSATGRDDADDFLAIDFLSIRVYHQQDGRWFGPDLSRTDRMPALLPSFVRPIRTNEDFWVFEY